MLSLSIHSPLEQHGLSGEGVRLCRNAEQDDLAVGFQQRQQCRDLMRSGHGIDDAVQGVHGSLQSWHIPRLLMT